MPRGAGGTTAAPLHARGGGDPAAGRKLRHADHALEPRAGVDEPESRSTPPATSSRSGSRTASSATPAAGGRQLRRGRRRSPARARRPAPPSRSAAARSSRRGCSRQRRQGRVEGRRKRHVRRSPTTYHHGRRDRRQIPTSRSTRPARRSSPGRPPALVLDTVRAGCASRRRERSSRRWRLSSRRPRRRRPHRQPKVAMAPNGRATLLWAYFEAPREQARHPLVGRALTSGNFGAQRSGLRSGARQRQRRLSRRRRRRPRTRAIGVWSAGAVQMSVRPSGGSFDNTIQDISGPGSFNSDPSVRFDPSGRAIAAWVITVGDDRVQATIAPEGATLRQRRRRRDRAGGPGLDRGPGADRRRQRGQRGHGVAARLRP